tara:strand:+ start:128 stop:367 length:240 start_codon:yes stop_codon:yes gene_type:complete
MKLFKKKVEKKISESKQLEEVVVEEFKKDYLPINQMDRLKCIYYTEFIKENLSLFNNDRVLFWHEASAYAERKLRSSKS